VPLTPEQDAEWNRLFVEARVALRPFIDALIRDRTCRQCHPIATAMMCEAERVIRMLYDKPELAVAEMYYRCADAAALEVSSASEKR